ncbi:hypothetical protein [Mesoplasma melaleucae]|uniref:Uncharacterized protein n=1 Tax=Mesoplasma melaleucae TaxID=81459 RepID=A0A2K8NWF4_9MOLU|nr:hypothetical protein [Mesoplasma melaleucae]ATZ18172.1 hypothetical protein EMELA_v1c06650 [Mesoplasma melaleucae]
MQYPLIEAIFFIWSAENEIINESVTPNNQNELKTWLKSAENNELNNLKQKGKHYWYERNDEKYGIQYEN